MRWNKACNFRFAEKLNNTKNPNKTGNGMTERKQLIAYKQAVQAANNKSKQMLGFKTLGIVGLKEKMNISFSAAYGAGLSYWTYGLPSLPYGCMMEIPGASCSLRQI